MNVLGLGHDVVDVPSFAEQLADEASGFEAATFTAGERAAVAPSGPRRVESLAVRFAAKEALIKAWSGARFGHPPAVAAVDLRDIEVVVDGWGRPSLVLHGPVDREVQRLAAGASVRAQVSLSHDGPVASAVVLLVLDDARDLRISP